MRQNIIKPNSTFCVIGLGLMGGSYAMALVKQGYRVLAVDTNEEALQWALRQGLIAEGVLAKEETAVINLLQKADGIVLALYPSAMLPWLQQYAGHIPQGTFVTDLAGVKGALAPAAEQLLDNGVLYASTHPMAGREASGVRNADCAIFEGANYIVVPTDNTKPQALQVAEELGRLLGFGHIIRLSAHEHDEMIGYVSQLTHAIAVCLMNANDNARLPDVTGDSFRDLTRIADINAGLWSELFLQNKKVLTAQIETFTACLTMLDDALKTDGRETLEQMFRQSTARRRQFGRKSPSEPIQNL
jgi:prephenate dehydrogenase